MKKEDGPRIAVFEVFGFDTHAAQCGDDGEHGQKLRQVDITFASLKNSLGKSFDNTLISSGAKNPKLITGTSPSKKPSSQTVYK